MIPAEIAVSADRREMRVEWSSGRAATLSATSLREACRCAWCTRDRILDRLPAEAAPAALDSAHALGSHGLHLTFSDGHARGIYPWRYLQALSRGDDGAARPGTAGGPPPSTHQRETTQDKRA